MKRNASSVRKVFAFGLTAVALLHPSAAPAQNFPVKPVRYVVPFGAGTSPDIVGRLMADRFTRMWGQQSHC